jgi:hypothetical protein
VGEDESQKLRVSAIPHIRASLLGQSFKSSVRRELEKLGENVDVRPFVRQYVAWLGNTHERLRTPLRPGVEEWEATLLGAIDRFRTDYPDEKFVALAAAKLADHGTWELKTWVYDKPIEYRRGWKERTAT